MATIYDFTNLERELSSLEKEFEKFESSFDTTIKQITSASFNKNEYGDKALEKRMNDLTSKAKREINDLYNSLVNNVRKDTHNSLEKIKSEARSVASYGNELNSSLKSINEINASYSNGDFESVILLIGGISKTSSSKDVDHYLALMEAESYDKICSEKIKVFEYGDYKYFDDYYSFCFAHKATHHIGNSRKLLFNAGCQIIEKDTSNISKADLFSICKKTLSCFKEFSETEKNTYLTMYKKVYLFSVTLFNDLSDSSYKKFDYMNVKSFLNDSVYFDSSDIKNNFFKNSSKDKAELFVYVKEYGALGSNESLNLAFEDTKQLGIGKGKEEYLEYWITRFDDAGWQYIEQIIEMQENRYETEVLVSNVLIKKLSLVKLIGSLFLHIAENYYFFAQKNANEINFDLFCKASIHLNELIKEMKKCHSAPDDILLLNKGIRIVDSMSYGMLVKYQKLCSQYNDSLIESLNCVLNDTSNRLLGKSYKKQLCHNSNLAPVDSVSKTVKLVTIDSRNKSRKKILLFSIIGSIIIIVAVILIIIFAQK
jgi:hypothetical protein